MHVVLVPGLLSDATVWAAQRASLCSDGHAVTVVASTGHVTMAGLAAAALAAASSAAGAAGQNDEPLAVAGHSLGGRIALEMVRQQPGRIGRLAVLDTGVHPRRDGEHESRGALVRLARERGMAAVTESWLPPMLHPDRRADPAIVEPLTAMVERNTPVSFAMQQQALLDRPDATPVLGTISVPTLALVGSHDAWSPVEQHEAIAAAVGDCELVVVEACGHMSPVEQPEAVTFALRRWLAR